MLSHERKWYVIFLAPTVIIFFFFYAYPLGNVAATSFTHWGLNAPMRFIGIKNYRVLFSDPTFQAGIVNTFIWMLLQGTVFMAIAVLTALLTVRQNSFTRIFKTIYLIPNMISIAALAMSFYFVFQPRFGILNSFIRAIGFRDFHKNWYFDYDTAFLTVTLTTIFFAGVAMLLIASEISAVPDSVIESAKVDGASQLKINLFIILPMVRNMIGTTMIISVAGVLKTFEVIYLTTNGGPGNETMNLSLYLYRMAMTNNNFGYANTIGTIILVLGVLTIVIISRLFRLSRSKTQ